MLPTCLSPGREVSNFAEKDDTFFKRKCILHFTLNQTHTLQQADLLTSLSASALLVFSEMSCFLSMCNV